MSADSIMAQSGPQNSSFGRRQWWVLALLCSASFMVVLDSATVFTALPSIERDLGFSGAGLQWVVSAYALSFGGFMLLGGRLADVLGRRRLFVLGTIVFLVASVFCGAAWSPEVLIGARFLQGLGAAIVTPAALSILLNTFEEGRPRNQALGFWFAVAMAGGIAGFLVGGPLTDGPGWVWIFYMNIPMGIAVLALTPLLLEESRASRRVATFDTAGAVTITAALVALIYAISEVPEAGWISLQTIGLLGVFGGLLALFVRIESRSAAPLVPLRLFRSRTLVGGNLLLVLFGAINTGIFFILTLYAQQVLGYSAMQFALAMVPLTVAVIIGAFIGQRFVIHFGMRALGVAGAVGHGIVLLLLMRISVEGSYVGEVLPALVILGLAGGVGAIAASIAALSGIAADDAGIASGIEESGWQVGSPLGVAILATIVASRSDHLLAGGADPLAAQTEASQFAFGAALAFVALGIAAALALLPGRSRAHERSAEEAAREPSLVA